MIRRLGSALVLIALVAGCSSPRPAPPAAAPDLGRGLAGKVTADRMVTHPRALQDIANANRGSRGDGTPGYDASVEYVVKTLRDRGFKVSTPQFDRLYSVSPGKPALTVAGRTYQVDHILLVAAAIPSFLRQFYQMFVWCEVCHAQIRTAGASKVC